MSIPGSATPLLLATTAAAPAAALQIDRSLRFNSADSAYLNRTPSSAGNRKTWTWSGWVKKSGGSGFEPFFSAGTTAWLDIAFNSDKLRCIFNAGVGAIGAISDAVFRDPSSWYHIVVAVNTTESTTADRIKFYVNGSSISHVAAGSGYPSQNYDTLVNSTTIHRFGADGNNTIRYGSSYLAEVHFIDGQALAPTDFGQLDSDNNWNPKAFSGSYGTNGFRLTFADNSSNSALGEDSSGNNNDFTVNNFLSSVVIQGYKGGDGYVYSAGNSSGGGGGGAGGAGDPGVSGVSAGDGGIGRQSSITGTATYYGGGGGGGSWGTAGGSGGNGGGGDGKLGGSSTGAANPGTDGLGGGGGGAGYASADWQAGGDGGSGRVIIRYASSHGALTAANSGSQTTVGSDYVYQWTTVGSGSITFPGSSAISVQYLVLGGGGGAETGGGGGGGVLEGTLSVTGGTSHTITVGDGGSGSVPYPNAAAAANGGNSVFSTLTALGGGRGGGGDSNAAPTSGGSGGGAGAVSGATTGGAGTGDDPADLDSLIDTPTNYDDGTNVGGNYATLNPLAGASGATLSNGNLDRAGSSGNKQSTIGMSSGKWYWEVTVSNASSLLSIGATEYDFDPTSYALNYSYASNGSKWIGTSNSSYGASYTVGDVIGFALDMDNGNLVAYKNGSSQGTLASSLTGKTLFANLRSDGTCGMSANFGQRPFAYPPGTSGGPSSDYKSLCTTNLPDPTIADGSTAMDATTYTGAAGTQTISGISHSPDFVWIKSRSIADQHCLFDTVRGTLARLQSNSTNAEATINQYGSLTAFNTDGFTLTAGSSGSDQTHGSSKTYVAWTWDGGTSTVSNTDGGITSSVRANASTGFSIVSWAGTGVGSATVGHGLNAAPKIVIIKNRTNTSDWAFYHTLVDGSYDYLYLNNTDANASSGWTAPTSSVFTASNASASSTNVIAYCFAPVEGYSAFGSYTGNGSTDGPFVYTGHRSRWLLVKSSSNAEHWVIWDTARSTFNYADDILRPNESAAELSNYSSGEVDILSNGFKLRGSWGATNGSNQTYIYASFSEHPFKTARAR